VVRNLILNSAVLCLTHHESDAMCPGNYILAFLADFVADVETKVQNTQQKQAGPTRSRLTALWRYFMRQSMPKTRQLVPDMYLMMATTSVVKIP
jgi:hypothetical protein